MIMYWALLFISSLLGDVARGQKLWSSSFAIPGNATYEYVVIGGGTAGNAIAMRLAEAGRSVAVVEAGGFYEVDNGNGSVIPALCSIQGTGTSPNDVLPRIDWGFHTTPQSGAAGRVINYQRGKTLGGSSARNYMATHRGTVGSYKKWAEAIGDSSYEWNAFLPFFEKSVTFTPPPSTRSANTTPIYDATVFNNSLNGPIQVTYPSYGGSWSSWAMLAYKRAGLKSIRGFDSGKLIGASYCKSSVEPKHQTRSSSQTAYLHRAIVHTDVQIYTYTLAKQIMFSADKTASEVVVETVGETYGLKATKEIILSAGAFQSPQLLMLSGVGPRNVLEKHAISLVHDLPGVGQGMQDQPLIAVSHRVDVLTSSASVNNPQAALQSAEEYIANRTGPLTSTGGAFGWEKLPGHLRSGFSESTKSALAWYPEDWPEFEYLGLNGYQGVAYISNRNDPADGYNYASIGACLVAPQSRGNVSLNSSDPHDAPLINPCWLCDRADVELVLAGFKRLREFFKLIPQVTLGAEAFPGPGNQTDAQILETLRKSVKTIWHAACTCKMGKLDDEMAVIDGRARVYGVNNLRVVDVSSFPLLPPGHPQATVYALAEKIAHDIIAGG